ncbi:MAG: sialidase family protein [Pseudomonadota bacterium]
MGSITDTAASVFRDFVTTGIPASGPHNPIKADIRSLFASVEATMATLSLGSVTVKKATRALLNADLAHVADTLALVYADATDANNDLYIKVGGSGAGSWTLTTVLHDILAAAAASDNSAVELAGTEASYFAIDAGAGATEQVARQDGTNPNYLGSLAGILTATGASLDTATHGEPTFKIEPADAFRISTSHFAYGAEFTVYLDMYLPAAGNATLLTLTNAGATEFIQVAWVAATGIIQIQHTNAGGSDFQTFSNLFKAVAGQWIELTYRYKSGDFALSINGEHTWHHLKHPMKSDGSYNAATTFALAYLGIEPANTIYLRHLLITNRSVSDADLPTFRLHREAPYLRASVTVAKNFGQANYDRAVEGGLALLDDGLKSGRAMFLCLNSYRRYLDGGGSPLGNGETPTKQISSILAWEPGDATVQILSQADYAVPPDIASGLGHTHQGPAYVRTHGANKGWIYRFHVNLDGYPAVKTTPIDDQLHSVGASRNIYLRKSKDGGQTWTAATLLIDPSDLTGGTDTAVTSPSGTSLQFPSTSAYPNRVAIPVYHNSESFIAYSDNDWTTFTISAALPDFVVSGVTYSANETSCVLAPNGDVLVFGRLVGSVGGDLENALGVYRSTNGCASFTFERVLVRTTVDPLAGLVASGVAYTVGYRGAAATQSAIQLDPDGAYSPNVGRVALFCSLNEPVAGLDRHGMGVQFFENDGFASRAQVDLLAQFRINGQCSAIPLFGGKYAALSFSSAVFNATNERTSYVCGVFELPNRALT